jgi:hypothetical protein
VAIDKVDIPVYDRLAALFDEAGTLYLKMAAEAAADWNKQKYYKLADEAITRAKRCKRKASAARGARKGHDTRKGQAG